MDPGLDLDRLAIAHGKSVPVAFGKDEELLRWEHVLGRPTALSLTVSERAIDDVPAGTASPDVVAEMRLLLRWGCGGTQSEAMCDLDRSTTLALACSWLSVTARYVGFFGLGGKPKMNVGAHLSEAPRGTLPPPRLTEHLAGPIAVGPLAGAILVPPFAWSVRPSVPFPAVGGAVDLEQLDGAGNPLCLHRYDVDRPAAFELLEDGARLVRFINNTAGPLARAALLFGLAL